MFDTVSQARPAICRGIEMNNKKKPEKENKWLEFCLWTVMCVCAIIVMQRFAANKTIVIADAHSEMSVSGSDALKEDETVRRSPLVLEKTPGEEGSFRIPLPKSIKAENVVMENRYADGELCLRIQCEDPGFFEENSLTGDTGNIRAGNCEVQENGVLLRLQMRQIMEYRSVIEGNMLVVACYEPGELYKHVVVLDPVGGGSDTGLTGEGVQEKDVALSVARQVQKKLSQADVRVYLTRTGDKELSDKDRLALIDQVGADIYIGIGVSKNDENPDRYGILCYYNEDYFIPGFGNVQLADMVTREVTISSSNRAAGLEAADEESILRQLTIPAAQLSMGFLSNSKECALLGQESYQEKLAEGILTALTQACQEMESLSAAGTAD